VAFIAAVVISYLIIYLLCLSLHLDICHQEGHPVCKTHCSNFLQRYGMVSHSTHYRSFQRRFYRSYDPTNSVIALKDDGYSNSQGPIPPCSAHWKVKRRM